MPTTPLSWPLPDEDLADVVVRWPYRYAWPNAANWLTPIRDGIAAHVPIERARITQFAGNLVVFEVMQGSRLLLRVGVDYDDPSVLHPRVDAVDLYFKMQFDRKRYDQAHVVPGGYVSPHLGLYRHARRWRTLPHTTDVFGRLGLRFNSAQRGRVLAAMSEQSLFKFEGGSNPVSWLEYMERMARSRLALDLPGRGDLCYRLVESLATGTPLVGTPLRNDLHVALPVTVRASDDEAALVDRCVRLLSDPAACQVAAHDSAVFFDRYLALPQLGAYYLHSAIAHATNQKPARATEDAPTMTQDG